MTGSLANPSLRLVLWACVVASTIKLQAGDFSMGMHVLILFIAALVVRNRNSMSRIRVKNILTIWGALIITHFLLSQSTTSCTDFFIKSLTSFCLFLLLLYSIGRVSSVTYLKTLTWDLRAIVALVTISLILDLILGLTPSGGAAFRASGIYPEPSHLALSMAPVLVGLMSAKANPDRVWGWVGFVAITILSASATIFVMVSLCFVVVILARSKKQFSLTLIFQLMLFLLFIVILVQISPYAEELANRITGLVEIDISSNLSSLVYINGWETALQNLQGSNGIGLGFNRMGCDPRPVTSTGDILNVLGLADYNFNDGSFIFSKLLSELGLIGIVFWVSTTGLLFRLMFRKIETPLSTLQPDVQALLLSGITVITFGAIFRGTNYFSGSFIFGIFCTFFILGNARWKSNRHSKRNAFLVLPSSLNPSKDDAHV